MIDGARVDFHNIGPFGVTVAGGRTVVYSLDSEYSASGNYFWGVDLHLENIRSLQLGVSYAMKYDAYDQAREELGVNFRWSYKYISPYAEVKYDFFSKTIDEGTIGIDIFPLSNLLIKAEFYQSYPIFDTDSIYSVFAVDQYREYSLRAEYSLDAPVSVYAAYAHQTYEDADNADRYTVGARIFPLKDLNVDASVDYREGYGGNLWGFEVTADYTIKNKLKFSGGIQYDEYQRPDQYGNEFARRYWVGGDWLITKKISALARIEEDVNQDFSHRFLGRVALNWYY